MKRFVSKLTACLMTCLMLCAVLPAAFAQDATALPSDGGTLADGSYILEDDVTLAEDLTIPSGVEVTIDLNGHTLTGTSSGRTISVAGILTLNDSSEAQSGVVTGGGVIVEGASSSEKATFTMNGGTITGNSSGSGGGIYVRYANFTMTGGAVTGNTATYGGGIYVRSYSTFVMNGGTVTGNTSSSNGGGVEINAGSASAHKSTFTMNGGTITNNSSDTGGGVYLYGYGYMVMNGGFVYNNSATSNGADIAVAAKGHATLNSTDQFDGSLTLADCGHTITGWYDDSRNSRWTEDSATAVDTSAELVSSYYLKAAHAAISYVASVTSGETVTKYETLQDAINAATTAGDKVTLLDDVTESVTVAADQTITLDLAGYTLTCASGNTAIEVVGNMTLEDSSEAQTGTIYGGRVLAEGTSKTVKGSFTMNGGTITGSDVGTTGSGGGVYVRYCNFTMNGGTITGNAADYGAGVYIRSYSTFVMNGGTITGNTAYDYGGGVEVNAGSSSALKSTFTMNGGTITGNSARIGGGVYLYGYGYMVMDGGFVYNNSSSVSGADIAVASKGHATLNSTNQFDGSLTLTDCNHAITGWYDDSRDTRWAEDNYTAVDTSTELVSAYYLKAAHGSVKVSEPGITKSADKSTANAGDTVTYTLTSTVPETLPVTYTYSETGAVGTASAYTLTFHDSVSDGLTASTDSIVVKIGESTIDSKYYTVSTGTDCTFEVAVDLAALYNDSVIGTSDLGISSVTVTYTATVGETTGALTNTAWVTWPDDGKSAEATATVTTYGISIYKYDLADSETGLAGAVFTLTDANENTIATLTSGEDGKVSISGLAEGTYYLTETNAPEGYVASTDPITVSTDEATDYVVSVSVANAQIPSTGGSGTAMYTMGGIAILVAAAALFLVSRKTLRNDQ